MTTVTRLKPRALRDAQAKLDAFIANARNELTAFGKDLEFDSDCWDVTEHYLAQGDRRAKQARVRFFFIKVPGACAPRAPRGPGSHRPAWVRPTMRARPPAATGW